MPVTKKKGAIFAIYADSPEKSTAKAPTATAQVKTSPTKRSISTTKPAVPRRALATIQPSSVKAPLRALDGKKAVNTVLDEKPKPKAIKTPLGESINGKQNIVSTRSSSSSTTATRPKLSAPTAVKRQIQVLSSPPPNKDTFPVQITANTRTLAPRLHSPTRSGASPPKRSRTTPKKSAFTVYISPEKENVPPPDSPASRTRSRTRAALSQQLEVELINERASSSISFEAAMKRGRVSGPMVKSTKTNSKAAPVRADKVLADVSEAYGASGIEPEGFRTAGIAERS